MNTRIFFTSLVCVVLLSGCGFVQQFMRPADDADKPAAPVEQNVPEESAARSQRSSVMTQEEIEIKAEFGEEGGSYQDYTEGVIGNGKTSVLFFAADWCPNCQKHDAMLKDVYSANYIPLSVYKVDYDKNEYLKTRYNVTQQDTFIRIDGGGHPKRTKVFPDQVAVLRMLKP